MALKLYNTLHKQVEEFVSIEKNKVKLYTCGMTVYDFAHIGHGRKYTMDDVLRRTLTLLGYTVNHVQNVTDVGHLSSDGDEGEDKMEKGALKTGKTVWEVAQFFTDDFYTAMDVLNIVRPTTVARATEHIPEQIKLIEQLIQNGYAYDTPEAVYFEVSKFTSYGSLSGQKLTDKLVAVREDVHTGTYKRGSHDFALWFKRVDRFKDHAMHWMSPWGDGFPGWHIECSAMSMKYLGDTLDIHTGGIDHIPVHHENEIAQSEGVTGKPFVNYWLHYSFLNVNGEKMSKSLGNYVRIQDVLDKGINPLALRYLYLGAQYRSHQNFTWEALSGAETALQNAYRAYNELGNPGEAVPHQEALDVFVRALENDLNTPEALACMWSVLKDTSISDAVKRSTIDIFDTVLGFDFKKQYEQSQNIPEDILELISNRDEARKNKNWSTSDSIRNTLVSYGYEVLDTDSGTKVRKI